MSEYDREYYETNNYGDYMERGDRYVHLAKETINLLDTLGIRHHNILDFGCAVGFLMDGLRENCDTLHGVDISNWALEYARQKGHEVSPSTHFVNQYDVTYALDVFEHMNENALDEFFDNVQTSTIVFRMPICEYEGDDYFYEVSRKDPTHIIRWTKEQWQDYFNQNGFFCIDMNLHTIYNSRGVYTGIAIKNEQV